MNREEVIKLAREQGLPETETEGVFIVNTDDLGRMLAAEREACAIVCDRMVMHGQVAEVRQRYNKAYADCRDKIRARGVK